MTVLTDPAFNDRLVTAMERIADKLDVISSLMQGGDGEAKSPRRLAFPDKIPPSNGSSSPYLDASAAAYLGIKRKALYGIVERGQIKPLPGPKKTYRFTTDILDDYLRRKSQK